MTRESKTVIAGTIKAYQGLKATELVAKPGMEKLMQIVGSEEIVSMIEEMIKDGELVEVEYIVPNMPDRIKSFLLPKGSKIL